MFLPHNPSTENRRIPGCSFILSVDILKVLVVVFAQKEISLPEIAEPVKQEVHVPSADLCEDVSALNLLAPSKKALNADCTSRRTHCVSSATLVCARLIRWVVVPLVLAGADSSVDGDRLLAGGPQTKRGAHRLPAESKWGPRGKPHTHTFPTASVCSVPRDC